MNRARNIVEFGDFQTPEVLATAIAELLSKLGVRPRSILEPTCGTGAFLRASAAAFSQAERIIGFDIQPTHVKIARAVSNTDERVTVHQSDFFNMTWNTIFEKNPAPWLIIGNPPWVTSAELSILDGRNLPAKTNFHGRTGIDAITGKSNFDISEWMLLRYLDWLEDKDGTIAVLCKTAVARKILLNAWDRLYPIRCASIHKIDASMHFGAAVDACLFVVEIAPNSLANTCDVFESLEASTVSHTIGYHKGHLISDISGFRKYGELLGPEEKYIWRSGIKHDCSKVMELKSEGKRYVNGFGEVVDLEERLLYPMLKSSDIGNARLHCRNVMLVTQRTVGEDTNSIKQNAAKSWAYLLAHAGDFDRRGSSVYKNKPPFSIFGVGPYSFSPWKIAISGFYKKLQFVCVGPVNNKPVVFDDTVYFLPCASEAEARFLECLLTSEPAVNFLRSMISWAEKRPITIDILKRLSIARLAKLLGRERDYARFTAASPGAPYPCDSHGASARNCVV